MNNELLNQQSPSGGMASIMVTQNVHLATFLSTCGYEPQSIKRGPERTQLGHPVVTFIYSDPNGEIEGIFFLWGKQSSIKPWAGLSKEERVVVVDFVSSHANNLRHFLAEVKKDE